MILSNEPGYYKAGEYGIRIENLVLVVEREVEGAEKEMLGFETLTFAPIERRLIVRNMLPAPRSPGSTPITPTCLAKIGPKLEGEDRAWLEAACAPLLSVTVLLSESEGVPRPRARPFDSRASLRTTVFLSLRCGFRAASFRRFKFSRSAAASRPSRSSSCPPRSCPMPAASRVDSAAGQRPDSCMLP